jgi:carboxypeptidase C (cathepsin A)
MGGHYFPAVAHHLWKRQQETLFTPDFADAISINLKGIAVGNGCTDPTEVNGCLA